MEARKLTVGRFRTAIPCLAHVGWQRTVVRSGQGWGTASERIVSSLPNSGENRSSPDASFFTVRHDVTNGGVQALDRRVWVHPAVTQRRLIKRSFVSLPLLEIAQTRPARHEEANGKLYWGQGIDKSELVDRGKQIDIAANRGPGGKRNESGGEIDPVLPA